MAYSLSVFKSPVSRLHRSEQTIREVSYYFASVLEQPRMGVILSIIYGLSRDIPLGLPSHLRTSLLKLLAARR